jgi:hypothetical protein
MGSMSVILIVNFPNLPSAELTITGWVALERVLVLIIALGALSASVGV